MFAGLCLFNYNFVVERINNTSGHRVPDQVVMNATKSIIAVYDVWLNDSAVIAAKIAGYNSIESSLYAAFLFQADEMVAS